MIFLAVPRLRSQEHDEQRRMKAEVSKLEAELQPQTEADRESALAKEVDSVTASAPAVRKAPPPVVTASPRPFSERMRRAREVGRAVIDRLHQLRPSKRSEVKLASQAAPPLLLDALFYTENERLEDLLVEIKIARPDSLMKNLLNRVDQALALRARYSARTRRSVTVWMVIVVDGDFELTDRIRRSIALGQADAPGVVVTAVPRSEIPDLQLPLGI